MHDQNTTNSQNYLLYHVHYFGCHFAHNNHRCTEMLYLEHHYDVLHAVHKDSTAHRDSVATYQNCYALRDRKNWIYRNLPLNPPIPKRHSARNNILLIHRILILLLQMGKYRIPANQQELMHRPTYNQHYLYCITQLLYF